MVKVIDIPETYFPRSVKLKPNRPEADFARSTAIVDNLLKFMDDARKEYGEDIRFVFPEGAKLEFAVDPSKLTTKNIMDLRNIEVPKGQLFFELAPGTGPETKIDMSGSSLGEADLI